MRPAPRHVANATRSQVSRPYLPPTQLPPWLLRRPPATWTVPEPRTEPWPGPPMAS